MESVRCICKNCDLEIGRFVNLWIKLGQFYVSPVIALDGGLAIENDGEVREGQRGLLVEHCQVQSVACAMCLQELGFKCIATPVNHVLEEGQLFLRSRCVVLCDDDSDEVEFVFKRVLESTQPSAGTGNSGAGPSQSGFETVDVFKLQSELQLQRADISRIYTNGAKAIHALERGLTNIEREVKKLQDTLRNVRRDVSGADHEIKSVKAEVGEVRRLAQSRPPAAAWEERLGSATAAIGEMQEELTGLATQYKSQLTELKVELGRNKQDIERLKSDIGQPAPSCQHDQVLPGVLAELAQLRRDMDRMRSKDQVQTTASFPSRELEILTANISKIGSRANQVEPLQMEFEILKGRVERMEASRQSSNPDSRPPPIVAGLRQDSPPQLKRALSRTGSPTTQNNAFKKQRVSPPPGYLNTPTESQKDSPKQEDTIPTTSAQNVRFTKSGKIDKRYQGNQKPSRTTQE